ncbi:MAG: hypothetical protein R2711_18475 [Acidimicrobiales bacterium]
MPQYLAAPAVVTAHEWRSPADTTATLLESPLTVTGVSVLVGNLSPSMLP